MPANVPPPENAKIEKKAFTKSLKSKGLGSIEEIPIVPDEPKKREPKGTASKDKKEMQVKRLLGQAYRVAKQPRRPDKSIITELFSGPQAFDIGDVSLKRRQGRAQRQADDYIMDQAAARGISMADLLAYKSWAAKKV